MNYFPLFADLRGEPVLVVGGGTVAERKIAPLLEAGASVRVVARKLNSQVRAWADEGRLNWVANEFADGMVHDVLLVIAATDDETLNRHVSQAAKAAKRLVNVVDRQELCTFITPAVIDRSPLQIAVSSNGTSPVLSRRVRQAVEKCVPFSFGTMAQLAAEARDDVKAALPDLARRRLFWEQLFDGVFADYCAQGRLNDARRELKQRLAADTPPQGSVCLVGAGPGDAGLLTLHALHAIQAADVVLYDALVSDEVMRLVRKDAEKICVGKRAQGHQVRQEETNRLLLEHARSGRRVVRLKGGDPFVFGRGGEELQVLAEAGIPFRIVPGITAALGATAYAGIPLTHRDYAQSVQFITGHCRADGSDVAWQNFAQNNQTLAVYMGTIRAAEIAAQLIRHGRAADTPVAIISNGTRRNQSVISGRLDRLADLAARAEAPALMVIGQTAALHGQLDWFGKRD
ncbi:siroheme synthase CysG [Neisseria leonii]|uniref:siroheme synthase CysG n=1 Tax=Neisseria leonii TaxID=2995413 RepID=UPI00237A773E|nr:siroheme synthase CysG [Neisseria sp. 3986]MDD9324833.1 siroheme synthase CysG [Neisseria sp. 3986]